MKEKVKVLHIVSSVNPLSGGVSVAVDTMISLLDYKDFCSEVLSLDSGNCDFLLKKKYKVHALGPGKTSWNYSNKLVKWLSDNIENYNTIIVHGIWQYHAYALYQVLKIKNKNFNVYLMPHGMLDPWFQKAKGRKIKAIRNWLFWRLFEKKIIHTVDALLFTCETEMVLARQTFKPYKPKSEIVIGFAVEAPPKYHEIMKVKFKEKCNGLEINDYFLFLSRIHPKKGIDILIRSYLSLKGKGHKLPKLVIAGPGLDESYGNEMKRLSLNDEDVFFLDMLTSDAKWGAFYGCEVFILPSHQENFGIVVVEALACSKPVLISNQVNIYPEVVNTRAGLIAPNTDDCVEAMIIEWLHMPKEKRIQMASQGRKLYEDEFTLGKVLRKLEGLQWN